MGMGDVSKSIQNYWQSLFFLVIKKKKKAKIANKNKNVYGKKFYELF